MSLTNSDCLWYAVIYAFMWIGTGYWLRRVVEAVKTPEKGREE